MKNSSSLSEVIAEKMQAMIRVEKKYKPGDRIPNEYELAEELKVSRTTIREAVKILVSNNVLEIRRGLGTFVLKENKNRLHSLLKSEVSIHDLYEIRLMFEPKVAYYAAQRANNMEIEHILEVGKQIEEKILHNADRTEEEFAFHRLIAKAAHNEFINELMPVIYEGIGKGVLLSKNNQMVTDSTLNDHRMIMEFLRERNSEGAEEAMKIHIIHASMYLNL